MSIEFILQTEGELRRLAVAGSRFARGDFRLQRLVDPIAGVGAKVPVFAKIADALRALLAATAETSAPLLLQASTLVNAVLATQSKTSVDGSVVPLSGQTQALVPNTNFSSRRLRPVIEALSRSGSGRLEIITEAFNDGLFQDYRLMRLALDHLEDPYPAVADFIVTKVLPSYGSAIVPYLESGFDLKGGNKHGRALSAIFAVKGEAILPLLTKVLDEGSTEVRVAAIECLGMIPSALPLLMKHSKAKNQQIRKAVFVAVGKKQDDNSIAFLAETLLGKEESYQEKDITLRTVRMNPSPNLSKLLAKALDEHSEKLLADPTNLENLQRITRILNVIKERDCAELRVSLKTCLLKLESFIAMPKNPNHRVGSGDDIVSLIVEAIVSSGDRNLRLMLMDRHEILGNFGLYKVVKAFFDDHSPEEVYNRLYPLVSKKSKGENKLLSSLPTHYNDVVWDKRWYDFAIKIKNDDLIFSCGNKDFPGFIDWLRARYAKAKDVDRFKCLEKMISALDIQEVMKYFDQELRKAYSPSGEYWHKSNLILMVQSFPPSIIPTLEALAKELPDQGTNDLLTAIETLKETASKS